MPPAPAGAGVGRNRAISIKAVGAAVERAPRIEVAHLRLQRRDLAARHIGRVRHDEIEARRQARPHSRRRRSAARRGGRARRALRRAHLERRRRCIGADPESAAAAPRATRAGARPSRCRDRRCAECVASVPLERRQRRLDHGLGFGPRHQHGGRHAQNRRPQNSLAPRMRATGSRRAAAPPAHVDRLDLARASALARPVRRVPPDRGRAAWREEHARVELGRIDAVRTKGPRARGACRRSSGPCRLKHFQEQWTPVFRQQMGPLIRTSACSDSTDRTCSGVTRLAFGASSSA